MPVAPLAALALALPVLAPGFQGSSASGQALGQLPDAGDPAPRDERAVLRDRTVAAGLAGLWTRSATDHAGGVAWIDYNGDHWSDLFIINGFGLPHWLFRNNGDGTFSDVTALIPKTNLLLEEASANFADFDGDGDLDLFVPVDAPTPVSILGGGPNTLYINNGAAGFSEEALPRGLVDAQGRRNISSGLADFDRDGDIDVYCGVWARLLFPLTFDDVLYVNDGSGHFSPLVGSRSWGYGRNALAMLWFDANDDRWPDVYVGNVGEFSNGYVIPENFDVFYTNDGDLLSFTDATPPNVGNDASAAMGMDVGDVDNDGDWDLYITDNPIEPQAPLGNVLYLGDGAGGLIDNTCDLAGVCSLNNSWPCNFADFDRDGWTDLWVGTTHLADPDHLFINQGDGTFVDTVQPAFQGNSSRGGSIADYDGDGRVDVAIWRSGQNLVLARNESVGANHWLEVKLTGTTSSTDAIGATLRLTSSGITQRGSRSTASSSSTRPAGCSRRP